MATAILSHNGQLALPPEIQERLGIQQGDEVELRVEDDGSVRMQRKIRSDDIDRYLALGYGTYDGLSEEDANEVEAIALDRKNFRTRTIDV